jgi:isoleucyl-tRNA synthetase
MSQVTFLADALHGPSGIGAKVGPSMSEPQPARDDYRRTLNLPRTDFPMRAELPKREPDRVRWWAEHDVYRKRLAKNAGNLPFILHDGPPYANGDLHMGHFLNRVLKDAFVKINLLDGRWADFVPGWDMHGLPIERETLVHLGLDFHQVDPLELRARCRERALYWLDRQRTQMLRMGLFGHFDDPYMTIDPRFEATIVETLADLAEEKQLYKGLRATLWCITDETALAEAEIEYHDHVSPSIYVRFPTTEAQRADLLRRFGLPATAGLPLRVAIWTTTPWTLPGNVAIALNPAEEYVLLELGGELVIVATALADVFAAKHAGEAGPAARRAVASGEALIGAAARHPFLDRDSPLVGADYVEMETGTGLVHTAPGHGAEDFETGVRYGLPILTPVDGAGRFTVAAGPYAGLEIFAAQERIIADLRAAGLLFSHESYAHSYPHCWRCKNPVVFRATAQWFIAMDANGLRDRIIAEIPAVTWTPTWGEERMTQMIENHPEWCVSRQRTWGTPIPALLCDGCQQSIVDPAVARIAAARFRADGAGVWWTEPASAFTPPGFACPGCGGTTFSKEMNIVDIWFESGVTHRAVLKDRGLPWPADVYLEGGDQFRGWFRSNLITAVATEEAPPYKHVVSTGWVVDQDGRAMHKSAGNYLGASEAMEKYGADVLRLWVASVDYTSDARLGAKLLENVANVYRNLRNRFRWYLGSVDDLTPDAIVPRAAMEPLDRLVLAKLDVVAAEIADAYRDFRLHDAYVALQRFDSDDLSAFYVDALKDRLYTSAPGAPRRRSAQSAILEIFRTIAVLAAPILSFTAEEAWQMLPAALRGDAASVFDLSFPRAVAPDAKALATWDLVKALRALVAANEGLRDFQLDATVKAPADAVADLAALGDGLREALVVSTLRAIEPAAQMSVDVGRAAGEKCERCWKFLPLGSDAARPTLCAPCATIVAAL